MSAQLSMAQRQEIEQAVRDALDRVYDPCSVAANTPLSLLEMGLLVGWRTTGRGVLHVTLCTTFAGCTMAPRFAEAAEVELGRIEGITSVRVDIDPLVFWTPERMTGKGRRRLADRAARLPKVDPPRPQEWKDRTRLHRSDDPTRSRGDVLS